MKKILVLTAAMLSVFFTSNAQDKKMSIGIGFGGAAASSKSDIDTKGSGFGLNFYLNGMYNINSRISAGIEYNSNLVVIADVDGLDLNVSATKINGLLAKGKFYLTEGRAKPYAGLMTGLYTLAPGSITAGGTGGSTIGIVFEKKSSFGFAPELGIQLGAFQIATSYHFIGKYATDFVNPIDGGVTTVTTNYKIWQFNIGWNIGILSN